MKEHGLPGAMVFSNVNGVALADARYEPLWAKGRCARRGASRSTRCIRSASRP